MEIHIHAVVKTTSQNSFPSLATSSVHIQFLSCLMCAHIMLPVWLQCLWLMFSYFILVGFHSSWLFLSLFFLVCLHYSLTLSSLQVFLTFWQADLVSLDTQCSEFVLFSFHFNPRQYHPELARDWSLTKGHWWMIPNMMTMNCELALLSETWARL